MQLSVMFPVFRGKKSKRVVQGGDAFFVHPAMPDNEGTVLPLFESLKIRTNRDFDIIAETRIDEQTRAFKR